MSENHRENTMTRIVSEFIKFSHNVLTETRCPEEILFVITKSHKINCM